MAAQDKQKLIVNLISKALKRNLEYGKKIWWLTNKATPETLKSQYENVMTIFNSLNGN